MRIHIFDVPVGTFQERSLEWEETTIRVAAPDEDQAVEIATALAKDREGVDDDQVRSGYPKSDVEIRPGITSGWVEDFLDSEGLAPTAEQLLAVVKYIEDRWHDFADRDELVSEAAVAVFNEGEEIPLADAQSGRP
jgi:hypothetical protein